MTCSPGISPNGSPLQKSPLPDSSTPQPALGFLTISLHTIDHQPRGAITFAHNGCRKLRAYAYDSSCLTVSTFNFGWTPILRLQPAISEVQKIERLPFIAAEDNTKACALASRHLLYRGSEATAWYEMGSMCTWEICWILPDPEKSGSTTGQVERDEERRRVQQKSDWLRVLGAWESHVQGEAASNETSD